jgi:hypothetical protein
MNFLENEVMNVKKKFVPLQSSSTMSGDGGAPEKEMDELTESGEQNREDE